MKFKKYDYLIYVLFPMLVMAFLAMYPQLTLLKNKGIEWQGSNFTSKGDETAYLAYTNALINGRPRKNDPFLGFDDSPEFPQKESLYSIQFIPPYVISIPARVLGLSTPTASILVNFLVAFLSPLAIFGLIYSITKDKIVASVGAIVVPCLGTAVVLQGVLGRRMIGSILIEFFGFLSNYQPAVAFPVFFLFCFLVWRLFTTIDRKKYILYSIASGFVLSILIFSYFYLWTTAVAWLGCISLLWLILRKSERCQTMIKGGIVGLMGIAALIPYFLMLSNRSTNTDDIQILIRSRVPNLTGITEILGFVVIVVLFYFIWKGFLEWSSSEVLFTLSLALTPFVLFNQQVITGQSLQPVHYEIFIANYLILLAFVLLIWLCFKSFNGDKTRLVFRGGLFCLALLAIAWGFHESSVYTQRNIKPAMKRDDVLAALKYIDQLEKMNPRPSEGKQKYATVFSTEWTVIELIPVVTSCRPLWNLHSSSAGGLNRLEEKELFYRFGYYSDIDKEELRKAIEENHFLMVVPIFGFAKVVPRLGKGDERITPQEEDLEVNKYANFIMKFDNSNASSPKLDYAVFPKVPEPTFQNLDLWYDRDEGKNFGDYIVFKLTSKQKTSKF